MSFIEDMQYLAQLRARASQMDTPVVMRTTVIATGVQESEEVLDLAVSRDIGTMTGRTIWAARRGRSVTITAIEVQP